MQYSLRVLTFSFLPPPFLILVNCTYSIGKNKNYKKKISHYRIDWCVS